MSEPFIQFCAADEDALQGLSAAQEHQMFNPFKIDPTKQLKKEYAKKLEEARDAQRNGKIPLCATLTAEAEEIGRRIDALKNGV